MALRVCNRPGCGQPLPEGRKTKRCKDCNRLQHEAYVRRRFESKEAFKAHIKMKNAERHRLHPEVYCAAAKRGRERIRAEMIAAYGSKCACCGETEPVFLTIEHINRDGAAHRRSLPHGSSTSVYYDLKRRGWPKEGFELLCFNCNRASWLLGICPHRKAS